MDSMLFHIIPHGCRIIPDCFFWTRHPLLAHNRPFSDAPTPSCPVFGLADPFLPGTVLLWTRPCSIWTRRPFLAWTCPFLDVPTPSCPEPSLFGTYGPLPAPFLDVPLISRPKSPLFGHTNPFLPHFWTCRPLLAWNRPFFDTRPTSFPVFGRADPFSPG